MPTVSETTLAAMPLGTPTSFGTIVPSFERLLGYVDASAAPAGAMIQWKLYATSGGVRALAAVSDPIPSSQHPYLIFAEPDEGVGRGISMIAGTTYEIVGTAIDGSLVNIKAGFVGYDIEANTQPNEVAPASHPLVFGQEVAFGSLAAHHVRVQVQFDQGLVANTRGEARVYGTITGAAGPITVLLARGQLTDSERDPGIPIDLSGLGFVTAQLRIIAQNPAVGAGAVTAVIIGADLNLDIGGGGIIVLANNAYAAGIIFRPGGAAWSPAVPNVFPVWGGAFPSVMAAIALTNGDVDVEIDDSIVSPAVIPAAGMPVGGWDMQGRVTFTCANPNAQSEALVSVPDGSTLLNLVGLTKVRLTGTPSAAGSDLPSLSYTHTMVMRMDFGGLVQGGASRRLVDVAALSVLTILMENGSFFSSNGAGAEMINLLAASSFISLFAVSGSQFFPSKDIVGGAGTAFLSRDRSGGTFITGPAYSGPALAIFLREGTDTAHTAIVPGPVTYVIDAAAILGSGQGFDEVVDAHGGVGAQVTVDLPDATLPMNKFRTIRIIDGNGSSAVTPIILAPFGAQNLNGANASKNLQSNWGTWFAFCDGAGWIVSQGAGI